MSNGHGGARNGSGRKAGPVTTQTRAAAEADAASGLIEPLSLILAEMRAEYAANHIDKAVALAVYCLPYRHPKLAALTVDANVTTPAALHIVEVVVAAAEPEGQGRLTG